MPPPPQIQFPRSASVLWSPLIIFFRILFKTWILQNSHLHLFSLISTLQAFISVLETLKEKNSNDKSCLHYISDSCDVRFYYHGKWGLKILSKTWQFFVNKYKEAYEYVISLNHEFKLFNGRGGGTNFWIAKLFTCSRRWQASVVLKPPSCTR